MSNDPTTMPSKGLPDRELALWMLDRMQDSEAFLAEIQAARVKGRPDILDTPDYVALHKSRLKKLYQGGDDGEYAEVPPALIGKIDAIIERDMMTSVEEFLEKAIAAYVEKHPMKTQDLPHEWETTFQAARAEVEGRTNGAFEPDFTAVLATSARAEIDRRHEVERGRDMGGQGRES
jgi:hypothetical protein